MMKVALVLALLAGALPSVGSAQEGGAGTRHGWSEEKCTRYAEAWEQVLARWGAAGISADFLDRHDAFIAGGCTIRGNVCPRSPRELELANVLTIAAMNAGTAGTFLPFACRD